MRYEIWVKDVKVYESDLDCGARVVVDGEEIFALDAKPMYGDPPEPAFGEGRFDKAWTWQAVTETGP